MHSTSLLSVVAHKKIFGQSAMIVALFLLVVPGLPARGQDGSSLADTARQARAQKQAQPKAEASQAQQIVDQLAEDQEDKDAPAGFKTYNAGAYKIWAPAPFTIDAHDVGGVVLTGPQVGSTRPVVLAGNPIVLHLENDDAFAEAARQFARGYAESANCTKSTVVGRSAYQCSLAGARLLGHSVSGNAMLVRGASGVLPVLCVANTESRARDILNNPNASYKAKRYAREVMQREDQDVRTAWQKCDSVFQSIRVKEGSAAQKATLTASDAVMDSPKSAPSPDAALDSTKAAAPAAGAVPPADAEGPVSLADIARQLHQPPAARAATAPAPAATAAPQSTIPAGFKVQAFTYCKSHTQQCWNASVLVPVDAQLVSSDCKQYVFETKVKGASFLLLMGPAGTESCPGRNPSDGSTVRWKQLVDPERERDPGTSSTISAEQTKLDGKMAFITQMRFKKGAADWIAKRAEVENNDAQLVVGCMAPKDTFADGDAICSGLIASLRLP
ncbi:MAG TPA: hypothetical protein VKF84_15595 [Candidatus Sulfotelmatobacter sp.]|nr:hypothetical protein [Candidatus Sulfotelmatobacter sp.]